ncbi:uncharacterized protein GIQ15_05222 [Arthroderma uncinatum]|uniref:uncharacterized protein n=1 Tax=Arthroderma uncinatum TaxID=74035 RepID=UPI00144A809E|nr:uncharacterized protein GIQ15_05222 [Arthroderma uncinatum]KAF3482463.1 hypothetical protein GIQ15_05222 [Arthroderma uncinatum]
MQQAEINEQNIKQSNMKDKIDIISVRDGLTSVSDQEHQFPIHYAYDYRHGIKHNYLKAPQLQLYEHIRRQTFLDLAARKESSGKKAAGRSDNGIYIDPVAAGLPWTSGILACRQSKHWRLSLDTVNLFLQELSGGDCAQIASRPGGSITRIAQEEILSNAANGWARFPIYLYPEADEQRARLLAVVNVFVFVFDDFWEMHDISTFTGVQKVFISRMQPESNSNIHHPETTLESLIDETIAEIFELDRKNGNDAGRVMIEEMIRFFNRPGPPEKYNSMDDYLLYRHQDAGISYVLGTVKFSLNSSVDINSPQLARYLRLVYHHVCIANDLGSWEKEKKAYDTGAAIYLINAVDVVRQQLNLSSFDAAMDMTRGLLFQVECEIDEELERLMREDTLSADEWRFVDATIHTMAGNVLSCITMSRFNQIAMEAQFRES